MENKEIPLDLLAGKNEPSYIDLATLGMLVVQYDSDIISNLIKAGLMDNLVKIDENGKVDYVGICETTKG